MQARTSVSDGSQSSVYLCVEMADREYTDDEVRTIIDRALEREPARAISHEQLLSIGEEIGLSREVMERAARELGDVRTVNRARTLVLQRRRRRFFNHLWTYVIINAFLFAINYLTTPGEWWVLFPLLGWGLGVIFHARADLSKHISERTLAREIKRLRPEREPGLAAQGALGSSSPRVRVESERAVDDTNLDEEPSEARDRMRQR